MSIHRIRKKKALKKAYTLVVLFFTSISIIQFSRQKLITKLQAGNYWQQSLKQAFFLIAGILKPKKQVILFGEEL